MGSHILAQLLARAACVVVVAGVAIGTAAGQEQAAAAGDVARVEKAIADYEDASKDKTKAAQRDKLLQWLGELDHPRATDYLRGELEKHGRTAFGATVVAAIGKQSRPELEGELAALVSDAGAPYAVRVAATRTIALQGDRGAKRMLDLAVAADDVAAPVVRTAVLQGLVTSRSPAVNAGLAKLVRDGDNARRLELLRRMEAIRDDGQVDEVRVFCVEKGDLAVAAVAWRQLAVAGHARAKRLTIDVLERVVDTPDAATAGELVRGLVMVRDPDFYPAILRFGAVGGREVSAALKAAAPHAADDPALLAWLIENGLDAESPAKLRVARELLSKAPAAAVQPLVDRVRKELKRNRKRVLDMVSGLHELLAKDPTWEQDVLTLASASDLESRLLGMSLLLELGAPAGVSAAQKCLSHRAWELRSLAFRYLTKCRDVTSIPGLIDRYEKEEGRLAHELDQALFVHTGTRCWTKRAWDEWWREHKSGFVLPHPDTVKSGGGSGGGKTVSYYDIPLVSARLAFLVDHSGSMNAQVGTDKKRNRLDAAKEQLRQVVEALPKTHQVNLIPFETGVTSLWDELHRLDNDSRREFLEFAEKIKLAGGTNIYGAIERAFQDPDVDTIYLLTDGDPSAGTLTDPGDIVDAVQYMNRTRQIVIHCISIGRDSQLLKDLATVTGGEYKYVR